MLASNIVNTFLSLSLNCEPLQNRNPKLVFKYSGYMLNVFWTGLNRIILNWIDMNEMYIKWKKLVTCPYLATREVGRYNCYEKSCALLKARDSLVKEKEEP